MARSQDRAKRKPSSGRYHPFRTKRKGELAGFSASTRLSEEKRLRTKRILGGHQKVSLLSANKINVADKKGKVAQSEIVNVVGNPANQNLVRRNVITKGAIVETKLGKVRITSRPGQEGVINGVLV